MSTEHGLTEEEVNERLMNLQDIKKGCTTLNLRVTAFSYLFATTSFDLISSLNITEVKL